MIPRPLVHSVFLGCAMLAVTACAPKKLTEVSVRKFVDAADKAFLEGKAGAVCGARSRAFTLTATEFEPAGDRQVSGFDEAKTIAAERQAAGEAVAGKVSKLDIKAFCAMAFETREYYRRTTLDRGPLAISVEAGGNRATVRAHYVTREPIYAYGESSVGSRADVEHQVASRQSESDDESVIVLEDGELQFLSTTSVTYSFRVAPERDRRL
jgi:hypothetical protein